MEEQGSHRADAADGFKRSTRLPPVAVLVASLTEQFARLLRGEKALLAEELSERRSRLTTGSGMLVGTALLGFFGAAVLVAAAIVAIALALPAWLSALLVAVALLLIAVGCVLLGMRKVKAANDTH